MGAGREGLGVGRPIRRPSASTPAPRTPRCHLAGSLPQDWLRASILPRAVTAGLGGGGGVTIPRSAGGDQRLRLEQGPGKSDPWLVSTTLGQAEKHLLSLDTLPDSRPHPALTQQAPHLGRCRPRSQELSPRGAGANHKRRKTTRPPGASGNGLLACPHPLPPTARQQRG